MEVYYCGFNGFKQVMINCSNISSTILWASKSIFSCYLLLTCLVLPGQVPSSADCDTLTCLTVANKSGSVPGKTVVDVAICWNYLVVADTDGITKYGLVNNKPSLER